MKKTYLNSEIKIASLLQSSKGICLFWMVLFSGLFANVTSAQKTWNGTTNTNWNIGTNWTPNGAPIATDNVIIPNVGNKPTISVAGAVCSTLNITNTGAGNNALTINSPGTLVVSGAITITGPTTASGTRDTTIDVSNGSLTANSISMVTSDSDSRDCKLLISTGMVNVSGSIAMTSDLDRSDITFSGTGTLNIGGTITGGKLIPSTGTVNYNNGGAQTIGSYTYNNLTLSGSSTKSFSVNTTIAGTLSIASGVVANLGSGLTHSASALTLGGIGTASGSWGSTTSSATNTNNTFFSAATGIVNVSNANGCNIPVTVIPNKVDKCSTSNNGSIAPTFTGGLANVRYIRLTNKYNGNGISDSEKLNLAEIQAFEVFTNTNVALSSAGAVASASTAYSATYSASKINDGINTGNMWHGGGNNDWVQIDLGSIKNLDYLRIYNRSDCCQFRAQNILLELFDGSNNLIYCKTINVYEGVNSSHYIDVNVLDLSWVPSFTTSLNRTGLGAGTYTLNYSDGAGYALNTPITIVAIDPTITTAVVPSVCRSTVAQTATLAYTATTGIPTNYSIVWNSTPTNSFVAVTNALLPASPISISVPANTPAGTYTGTLTVRNANGCVSSGNSFTVTVNGTPLITPNKVDETCSLSNNGTIYPVLSGGLSNIRYIKLSQKFVDPDAWQQVGEIEAFEIFTGTNVALASNGATASATSIYSPSYPASSAIDGNNSGNNNFWHSGSTNINEHIIVDLQSGKNIDYLRIYNRTDCCSIRGQNMLLELFNGSNTLVYSKTIDLYQSGANVPVNINVLDVSWADSATTLNRTGLDSGTYTLNYVDGVGCSISSVVNIAATNNSPSAPIVGTRTQPNCTISTGSVDLSGLPASGTWTLVATPGGTTTTGTGTTTTITGLVPNTYTFTVSNGTCTSSATPNVVINSVIATTWNGAVWNNGAPTSTTAAIINGNYSASSNGDINACSLTINSGFKLTIEAGKFVIIQNNLTVAAGATLDVLNIGSLVMINDAPGMVSGTGTTIVRKTTTPTKKLDYVYWSSPVTTTTIGSTFWNWRTDRAFEYNNGWVYATTMNPAKGYIITAPNAGGLAFVDFQGQVNNGIQKITGVTASNFYLIGNPYPSAIDANAFLNYNSGALDGTLYFWTHNTAIQLASGIDPIKAGSGAYAFTSDDYASYNLVGGVGTGSLPISGDAAIPSKSSKPSGAIPSCQGFFASTKASITSTEIVFNNAMRLGSGATKLDNSNFFRTKNTTAKTSNTFERHRIWLNLTNKGGAFKQTLVGYVTEATNENETRFDGETMDGNSFIDFYSVNENKNLVIQGRALPFDDTDEVPLGFKSSLAGEFNISIDEVDGLLANQSVFLEDKLTNTEFDLKKGNFTFSTAAGTFNNRFVLKYKKTEETLGTGDFDTQQNKVIVSVKNKQIKINSFSETIDKVVIYDLSGKLINQKNNINSNEFLVSDFVLNHQALIVKTTLQNGIIVTDKVVY